MGKFSNNWKRRNGNFLGISEVSLILYAPWRSLEWSFSW